MFDSFSKYFSMTGWRIGWMLVPERLRRAVDVLTGQLHDLPAGAGPARRGRGVHRRRRTPSATATSRATPPTARLLLDGLPRLGIDRLAPADGAFYVYADVGHLTDDSMAFVPPTAAETGVATAPGIDFDTQVGNRFLRFSSAGDPDEIAGAAAGSAPGSGEPGRAAADAPDDQSASVSGSRSFAALRSLRSGRRSAFRRVVVDGRGPRDDRAQCGFVAGVGAGLGLAEQPLGLAQHVHGPSGQFSGRFCLISLRVAR